MSLTGGPDEPPTKSGLSLVGFPGWVRSGAGGGGRGLARAPGGGRPRCGPIALRDRAGPAELHGRPGWRPCGWQPKPRAGIRAPDAHPIPDLRGFRRVHRRRLREGGAVAEVLRGDRAAGSRRRLLDLPTSARATENREVLLPILRAVMAQPQRCLPGRTPPGPVASRSLRSTTWTAHCTTSRRSPAGSVIGYEHPTLGTCAHGRQPVRCRDDRRRRRARAVPRRAHAASLLAEICGYSDERLERVDGGRSVRGGCGRSRLDMNDWEGLDRASICDHGLGSTPARRTTWRSRSTASRTSPRATRSHPPGTGSTSTT